MSIAIGWRRRLWQRWLDKRIPKSGTFELHHGNIFIFPSTFGLMFIAICSMLFLLGINYQNTLITLFSYFLLALVIASMLVAYFNFKGLRFKLGKLHPTFAGDNAAIPLWVEKGEHSGKLHFNFIDGSPPASMDLDQHQFQTPVPLLATKRGRHGLPKLKVQSFFPLGLVRCWTYLPFAAFQWVYPKPIAWQVKASSQQSAIQDHRASSQKQGQDDFDSLRGYRLGDPLRHVAWKQFAKGQGMLSKAFTTASQEELWLLFDATPATDTETKLSQLCFGLLAYEQQSIRYGLALPAYSIEPGTGSEHLSRCLQALAAYQESRLV